MLTPILIPIFQAVILFFVVATGFSLMISPPAAKRLLKPFLKSMAVMIILFQLNRALTMAVTTILPQVERVVTLPVVITIWLATSPIAYAVLRKRRPKR